VTERVARGQKARLIAGEKTAFAGSKRFSRVSELAFTWLGLLYATLMLFMLLRTDGWLARLFRWRFLLEFGTLFYCIYLIQMAVLHLCHGIFLNSVPRIDAVSGVAVTLLAAALTWAIARLSWIYFEKPLVQRGHRFAYWPKAEPLAAVALVQPGLTA
jgi:peptidoglycan/LPS O-acetylase OafA/YrhL